MEEIFSNSVLSPSCYSHRMLSHYSAVVLKAVLESQSLCLKVKILSENVKLYMTINNIGNNHYSVTLLVREWDTE